MNWIGMQQKSAWEGQGPSHRACWRPQNAFHRASQGPIFTSSNINKLRGSAKARGRAGGPRRPEVRTYFYSSSSVGRTPEPFIILARASAKAQTLPSRGTPQGHFFKFCIVQSFIWSWHVKAKGWVCFHKGQCHRSCNKQEPRERFHSRANLEHSLPENRATPRTMYRTWEEAGMQGPKPGNQRGPRTWSRFWGLKTGEKVSSLEGRGPKPQREAPCRRTRSSRRVQPEINVSFCSW